MREILFRGKRVDNGTWAYGDLLHCDDEMEINSESLGENGGYIIPKTVGQYTGLTDKNGKEIFEGDIIRHHYKNLAKNGYTSDKGVVKWDCKECFFYRTSLSGKDKTISVDCIYEVIGNIHDNPELLEVEEHE